MLSSYENMGSLGRAGEVSLLVEKIVPPGSRVGLTNCNLYALNLVLFSVEGNGKLSY